MSRDITDLALVRSAVLSPCGFYRYRLGRTWDNRLPVLLFIMLNPSTADANVDDATIRVCMGRAMRMDCGGIMVVNLFGYRATSPLDMLVAADPIGPSNDVYIEETLAAKPKLAIAAWGVGGNHMDRARKIADKCHAFGVPLHCLGVTKDGSPRHPLRIGYAVSPVLWNRP